MEVFMLEELKQKVLKANKEKKLNLWLAYQKKALVTIKNFIGKKIINKLISNEQLY